MIKVLSVYLLVIGLSVQACERGCLKCNSKNQCIFCDVSSNYYLSGTNCAVSNNPNCMILNLNGDCIQCRPNYYLDMPTLKCVAVDRSKAIANCAFYGNGYACAKCSKNYTISNGKCVPVPSPIDNCDSYSTDSNCASCFSGYMLNSNRDACIPVPASSNCAAYSFLDCKACAPGYIANKNLYFVNYQSAISVLFSDVRNAVFNDMTYNWSLLNHCQKIQDPNCLEATSVNFCTKCKAGYFLTTDGACQIYPGPPVDGCQIYNSLTSCVACQPGYFLEKTSKCSVVSGSQAIANCTAYNNTSSIVQCVECSSTRYLSNNTCIPTRVDSLNIVNCKTTTTNADTCSVCNDGYILTNDGKRCLKAIDKCKEYASTDASTTTLTCKSCSDTYYLNTDNFGTTCIVGTIEGCLVYTSSTACKTCNSNSYYLDNSQCTKHVNIQNCAVYSGINFNQCATCITGYYPFSISSTCRSIDVILNCVQYSDPSICSSCSDGFFLKDNSCFSIANTFQNCDKAFNNAVNCGQCSKGFALKNLVDDKSCVMNHDYILDQCDVAGSNIVLKSNNAMDNDSCAVCKENSVPFDFSNLFACIKNSMLNTRGISDGMSNCKQYSNDAIPVCLQCNAYLTIANSGARTCSDTCNSSSNTIIKDNLDGSMNTCSSNASNGSFSITGCSSAIKVYDSGLVLKCMKYASNKIYVPLTSAASNNPTYWRDIDDSSVPRPDGAFLYFGYPVFNSLITDTDSHQNEGDAKKNCELYWRTGTILYCYRCKWGYASKHYIPVGESVLKTRCVQIDGCDTSVSYTGFSAQLNQMLSCHACTNNQFVTVIVGTATDNTNFNVNSLVRNKQTIQCLSVETNVNFAASETKPKFVSGCLIYGWIFLNTDPTSPVAPSFAKGCLACKPGYKLSENFGACMLIKNCDNTVNLMANKCTVCTQTNDSGVPELKALKNFIAEECVLVSTDNCLFADSTPDSNNQYACTVCRPGYWLNHDKVCEIIALSFCTDGIGNTNFVPLPNLISTTSISTYYTFKYLSKANSVSGCNTCNTDYTAIRMNAGETQCVGSQYVAQNTYVSSNSGYVADCAKYKNLISKSESPVTTCSVCKPGKIITNTGKKCVDSISNCLIASSTDTSKCLICQITHTAIAGACVVKNIPNCSTYDTSQNLTQQLCVNCLDSYVLSTDRKSCYKGKVFACKSYDLDLPWVCNTCYEGYHKLSIANSKTYCLRVNDGSNCKVLSTSLTNGLQAGVYKCNVCMVSNTAAYFVQSYVTSDVTLPQSICLSLNLIDKCYSYATDQTKIASNTFLCTSCMTGYYLDEKNNACIIRAIQPAGCVAYYDNKDRCKTCSTSTFKNDSETDCISIPLGIMGCNTYSNNKTCTSCHPPWYLKDNACIVSTSIDKCTNYTANNTCTNCESGYYLANSTYCGIPIARNCYTYSSNITCQACDPTDPNKGLQTDDAGVTNCVDKNVTNCDISTDKYPFTCIKCKKEFYLETDGNCTPVNATISKCAEYDGSNSCAQCEQGYVLNGQKTSCTDPFLTAFNDINCFDSQVLGTPVCSKCKLGYVFVNGTCTSCTKNNYSSGCFSCDPANQSNCLACRPGYYQTSSGACVSLIIPMINNSNSTTSTKSSELISLLSLLAVMSILTIPNFD